MEIIQIEKMAIRLKVKKWGSSLGVILPKDLVKRYNIGENDNIMINVVKEANLAEDFGKLKRKKGVSGQDLKDLSRKGWEK